MKDSAREKGKERNSAIETMRKKKEWRGKDARQVNFESVTNNLD